MYETLSMWRLPKIGVPPKWILYTGKSNQIDDLEVLLFQQTSVWMYQVLWMYRIELYPYEWYIYICISVWLYQTLQIYPYECINCMSIQIYMSMYRIHRGILVHVWAYHLSTWIYRIIWVYGYTCLCTESTGEYSYMFERWFNCCNIQNIGCGNAGSKALQLKAPQASV